MTTTTKMKHRVLEASAGTGKTYQIIKHAHELIIERGVPIERLAIVTFSERAAGELRKRLREDLEACLPADEARAERCRRALTGLDRAMVTTIHGFCFAILREYAFETGELFEQGVTDMADLFPDLFERFVRGELRCIVLKEPKPEETARRLAENGFYQDLAGETCRFYHPETCELHPDPDRPFDPQPLCQSIVNELSEVKVVKKSTGARDTIHKTAAALREILTDGAGGRQLADTLMERQDWRVVFNKNGSLNAYVENILKNECPSGEGAAGLLNGLVRALHTAPRWIVSRIVRDCARFGRLLMRHEGLIDYPAMLNRTLEALEGSPALVKHLQVRFAAALVDEFQDTDPVQWRMFEKLFTGGPNRHLFVVGDPKQAIYGFRGADVVTFQDAVTRLVRDNGAETETLDRNFRSSPMLVTALDRLFSESGIVSGYQKVTPASERQLEENGEPDSRPLQFVGSTARRASEAREEYVAFVVRETQDLLSGRYSFRGKETVRPLSPDDIAILVRGAPDERRVTSALAEAGIPFVTRRHAGLMQSREAGEIALVLDAVANPSDASAVKKALLTRFFRYPVDRLEGFTGLSPRDQLAVRFRAWAELAEAGKWPTLFRALLTETGRLLDAATSDDDPDAGVTTLLDLGRELALIAERERLDLAGLSRRIAADRKRGTIDDQPGLLLRVESDQPKVQIMTMHAAKGLEFPVVFILGWFTSTDFDTFRRYHVPEPGPAGTRKWRIDLSGSDEAKRLSAHEEQDEERRLFYVAMTRAIGRVYMPLGIPEKNPKKAGPIYEYLREGIEKAFPGLTAGPTGNHAGVALRLTEPADGAGPAPSEPEISARTVSSQLVFEPPPERIPTRDRLFIPVNSFSSLASRGGPEPVAPESQPSAVVALEDDRETTGAAIEFLPCDEPPDAEEAAGAAAEPDIGLPAGARTGTLFHALMEQLDYEAVMAAKTPSDLLAEGTPSAELIGRLFRRYPIRRLHDPADAARLAELAWNTLRTPLEFLGGQPLAACRERRHEMVFWMPAPGAAARELLGTTVSGGLLTGALDLVIKYNDIYYIIDFKTNRSRAGYGGTALDGIMEEHRYRLQYLLYGAALRRLLRGPEQRTGATRLAGAGYLFVRGMTGAKGSPGVFHGDLSDAILDRFERETLPALLGKRTDAGGEA